MLSIKTIVANLFSQAIGDLFGAQFADIDPLIQLASRPEFGDYQANIALSLAKRQQTNPLALAAKIIATLKTNAVFASLTVSGPGFINIQLADTFLNGIMQELINDPHFNAIKTTQSKTIVVEYGGPNIAKEMHVGHLRSIVIGDAIARILSFLGHHVIRQNHLGDWGTQFGMLIEHIIDEKIAVNDNAAISNLNALYKQAKQRFDHDEAFAKHARARVVLLQSGDKPSLKIWQALVHQSEAYFHDIYTQLDVLLTPQDNRGESFYNSLLPGMVEELMLAGIAQQDQGAVVIPLAHFTDQENRPLPLLIRKTDGGYLYATTDLAAARFRAQNLHADSVIYVVDARQALHFAMLFAALKKTGWIKPSLQLNHLGFGAVLGADKKPFKTRSGETIKLIDLLHEAEHRALQVMMERHCGLSPQQKQQVAQVVGIGALKYADLANDLVHDYVFDWDKILSFNGNTAPYLQNAYVRIQAIFRKGGIDSQALASQSLDLTTLEEHRLVVKVLSFGELIQTVATELRPHKLCNYLFELATEFHHFYEICPVLNADSNQRSTRLVLLSAVANVLKTGLELLGIKTLERM